MIKLESIYIVRTYDGSALRGEIKFSGDLGIVQLKLSDEKTRQITKIIAEDLAELSRTVAKELYAEVISELPLLENKEDK